METYYQVCWYRWCSCLTKWPLNAVMRNSCIFEKKSEPLINVCMWLQESGRAGRDGLPSECVLYYRPGDVPRQASLYLVLLSWCDFLLFLTTICAIFLMNRVWWSSMKIVACKIFMTLCGIVTCTHTILSNTILIFRMPSKWYKFC
jgi:hypothetical protein